jgi:hypothetical protein
VGFHIALHVSPNVFSHQPDAFTGPVRSIAGKKIGRLASVKYLCIRINNSQSYLGRIIPSVFAQKERKNLHPLEVLGSLQKHY